MSFTHTDHNKIYTNIDADYVLKKIRNKKLKNIYGDKYIGYYKVESNIMLEIYYEYSNFLKKIRPNCKISCSYINMYPVKKIPLNHIVRSKKSKTNVSLTNIYPKKKTQLNYNINFSSCSIYSTLLALFLTPQVFDITLENMVIMESSNNMDELTNAILETYPLLYKLIDKKLLQIIPIEFWLSLLKFKPDISDTFITGLISLGIVSMDTIFWNIHSENYNSITIRRIIQYMVNTGKNIINVLNNNHFHDFYDTQSHENKYKYYRFNYLLCDFTYKLKFHQFIDFIKLLKEFNINLDDSNNKYDYNINDNVYCNIMRSSWTFAQRIEATILLIDYCTYNNWDHIYEHQKDEQWLPLQYDKLINLLDTVIKHGIQISHSFVNDCLNSKYSFKTVCHLFDIIKDNIKYNPFENNLCSANLMKKNWSYNQITRILTNYPTLIKISTENILWCLSKNWSFDEKIAFLDKYLMNDDSVLLSYNIFEYVHKELSMFLQNSLYYQIMILLDKYLLQITPSDTIKSNKLYLGCIDNKYLTIKQKSNIIYKLFEIIEPFDNICSKYLTRNNMMNQTDAYLEIFKKLGNYRK